MASGAAHGFGRLDLTAAIQNGDGGARGILFKTAPRPAGSAAERVNGVLRVRQRRLLDRAGRPPAPGGGREDRLPVQHALSGMHPGMRAQNARQIVRH